jgi:hypothetical protein
MQSTDISEEKAELCYLFHAGFLLGLIFGPKDGDSVLQNVR